MDPRLSPAPEVPAFAGRLRELIGPLAVYVGGSLAFGDYRPGISDMDVIAVTRARPDRRELKTVVALHKELAVEKLHCAYLPADDATDLAREHAYWAHGRLYERAVSGIARAELLRGGITVFGPAPEELVPSLSVDEVRRAALAELTGYWSWAVTRRRIWADDLYVDLGLVTLARVAATVDADRLITKAEAIARLGDFGVPVELAEQIRRRRDGETVPLTGRERVQRGDLARRLVREGIARLVA
ncbi:nucleotidyltransferase [Actinorhabdospora filicis]|uniref:Nucleotidyltransferase n=1 Tax=Actinorhabdospora filicis TaxID=1785913 RepID=A0A9W6SWG9_9ACTN|nr:nucleotidyltransferase domain-containing protein [Actinorhabdospora filicis]GLZ82001.1 nucleotidyltransferase [Actinorhabdospora filicis]